MYTSSEGSVKFAHFPANQDRLFFHQHNKLTFLKLHCWTDWKSVNLSPFLILYLGSIGITSVLCYKGKILQRNYGKMTILWSFSYKSFVKCHEEKISTPQHGCVMSKFVLYMFCYKGTALLVIY